MSAFNPIVRELEHEDSNNHVTTITGVDITPHLLSAFPTTAEAVAAMNDETILIEALRVAFEQDPSLADDDGNQYAWSLYESELRETLLISLDIDEDDGTMSDEEVWETWVAAATADGVGDRHLVSLRAAFENRIDGVIVEYEGPLGDDILIDLATMLLRREGMIDALRTALASYEGPDVVGALRLASDMGDRQGS